MNIASITDNNPLRFVFVATQQNEIPFGCVNYLSVDGSVPGAKCCWDHHVTGEAINLDAMPDYISLEGYDGVGTTMADVDAVASVVAVLLGGKSKLPIAARQILESASHWCDHLVPHPGFDGEVNRLGRGLLDAVNEELFSADTLARSSTRFEAVSRAIATTVRNNDPLPYSDHYERQCEMALGLISEGRLLHQRGVAICDLRGHQHIDLGALYRQHTSPVGLFVGSHNKGGLRYTVGINPFSDRKPANLTPSLCALARAEFSHGPPTLAAVPGPGSENWGGRTTVFGSPWNYGSRLTINQVVDILVETAGI